MSVSTRLFDSGVWLALAFGSHPHHTAAAADSTQPVAFCRATQTSFLRLLTTPTIQALFGGPTVSNQEAWA